MGIAGPLVKNAIKYGLPIIGTLAIFKTKVAEPGTYDADQPRARDGAPRPTGEKQIQDAAFGCEALTGKVCDGGDVQDWLHTYYTKVIVPMSKAAQALHSVAPADNEDAQFLIAQSNAILEQFNTQYPGWQASWESVSVPDGSELSEIYAINEKIDVAIALKKEMLRAYGALNPGVIPAGVSPTDIPFVKEGAESVGFVPYAAAGTILGLGVALAFVVAANQKKRRPGG